MAFIPTPKNQNIIDPRANYRPSTIDIYPWLYITDETQIHQEAIRPGKWLIFVPVEELDQIWQIIRAATMLGQLGPSSKTSTNYNNPHASNQNTKVICVYTNDHEDLPDVKRVRQKLRELGITQKIPYKTDDATIEGKYVNQGIKRISKYYE